MSIDELLPVSPESLNDDDDSVNDRARPAFRVVTKTFMAPPVIIFMPAAHEVTSLDSALVRQVKRRGYSSYEWAKIFPVLSKLYVDLDMTLPDAMQKLSAEHNFHATYVVSHPDRKHY